MSSSFVNPSYYADFNGLEGLKKDVKANDPKAIRAAAQQFESLFTEMMLKSMRAAKLGDGLGESEQSDLYQDMYDQQIALKLSQGKGIGLADMLVQQLTRNRALKGSGQGGGGTASAAAPATDLHRTVGATAIRPSGGDSTVAAGSTASRSYGVTKAAAGAAATAGSQPVGAAARMSFVRSVEPYAQRAAAQLGVSPDALIAQAALETGWGQHVPAATDGSSSYNLFGIKTGDDWTGSAVNARTTEYSSRGDGASVVQPFRAYASVQQGVDDYVDLLRGNPAYRQALGTGSDIGAFATALQRGGYATDPNYVSKLAATAGSVRAMRDTPLKLAASLPTSSGAESA